MPFLWILLFFPENSPIITELWDLKWDFVFSNEKLFSKLDATSQFYFSIWCSLHSCWKDRGVLIYDVLRLIMKGIGTWERVLKEWDKTWLEIWPWNTLEMSPRQGIGLRDFSTCTEVGPRPASELCRLFCANVSFWPWDQWVKETVLTL